MADWEEVLWVNKLNKWSQPLQDAVTNAVLGVKIYSPQLPAGLGPAPELNIGTATIKIHGKGTSQVPFQIVGCDSQGDKIGYDSQGEEVTELNDDMPVIHGTSTGVMAPEEIKNLEDGTIINEIWGPFQDSSQKKREDIGIFHVGPGCFVKISGLHLVQDAVTNHGSATIANVVDNTQPSSLTVSNCRIRTIATAAISVRSYVDSTAPAKHDVAIRGCHVIGLPDPALIPDPTKKRGNYSSVNLGYWGRKPLSVSTFKVSGCILESLFLGVAVWYVSGDSNSMFLVAGNDIGIGKGYDGKGNDGTAVGVSFSSNPKTFTNPKTLKDVTPPASFPHGTIAIIENNMRIGRYMSGPGAAGILISADKDPQVRTIVSHNAICMALMALPSDDPKASFENVRGITYRQSAAFTEPNNFACNVTADIHNNSISLSPPAAKAPGYGIYLGPFSHLVRVTDNRLKEMTASTALIGVVDKSASRNILVGNEFGKLSNGAKAGILCDGSENSITENDFTASEIGWTIGDGKTDQVCIKLGPNSKKNLAVLKQTEVPGGTVANSQWINELNVVAGSSDENIVIVIPEFELVPIISQISPEAWVNFVMYYLEDLKLAIRQWPISPPGPPATLRRISQLKREVLTNLAKAGD